MSKKDKAQRPKARRPKGFRDAFAPQVIARRDMLDKISSVYERFGFQPLETSSIEYVDALGKFLPDKDAPDTGIFAFRDDLDDQWLGLRYDLTAQLARVVAEHRLELPTPFRRYQYGPVWRREIKPGKDRFRQFYQCDFDTVGAGSITADAEVCEVLAAAMRALGINDFVIRVNNRKVLNGLLEVLGIDDPAICGDVLRSLDKLDDLGMEGLAAQLGEGRKDKSGSIVAGVGLETPAIDQLLAYLQCRADDRAATCAALMKMTEASEAGREGVEELMQIDELLQVMDLGPEQVRFDPSLVRGLDYYTGPVFEIELPFEVKVKGKTKKFGSVAGGGRYDYLVERFTGQKVPATGASIGVDRLLAALEHLEGDSQELPLGPVIVTIMEKDRLGEYQRMVQELRSASIAAELYHGSSGFKAQMKYADRRRAPVVVIAGGSEFEKGEVTLKNMGLGKKLAEEIDDNKTWRNEQPAQTTVASNQLAASVQAILRGE
ncbi:histidine--tRNA ligase [Adhaeretor mobilis]|uniref:Histidine--tRNA ligase n=1 Tax=Adhaeretor mobilis TaxID=1930276 RepID=A0A517MZH9_9BACT|nr:histidine--tRNA ligase [Adhaeretor mobilis]QDT00291.1 Histidine--tRNA ligase [Adhaeretor mobilis]